MVHHIWCNEQNPMDPALGAYECGCQQWFYKYPWNEMDDPEGDKLQRRYFPGVVRVRANQ